MIEISRFEEVLQIRMSREIGGKPVYWVSAYLIDGLLIDTGCRYTAEELASLLEDKRLDLAVNTHFHEDHVGGNDLIQSRHHKNIYAHPDSIPLIRSKQKLYPYQEMVWGYPVPTETKPLPEVIETECFNFDVIETPGHSVGHVVLVERSKGWCFSGDIFARETPKFIRPEEDMAQTVASLKTISALPTDRLVLFTSVGRIVENGRQSLGECVRYLEDMAQKAKEQAQKGLDIPAIVTDFFGGEHPFAELTNGQYSTENLIRSLLKMTDGHE